MTASKHPKGGPNEEGLGDGIPRPPSDEERNPGIGSSKGVFGRGTDPAALQGENTDEGDTANDTTSQGGVAPGQMGRTNK
ncbi:hypothetical protein [Roseomonas xinghualingensis]|uniref:hypothetical protein n=1 Tax=Roseomonas xinghualingensis TaxID=2986475 RepID=UPI0021F1A784|nr:hypothetical protein [Roseomonas sp. SXEYE001]MCV4206033.1 hypothetical protein [Roseomonas sp. SXEYE001]